MLLSTAAIRQSALDVWRSPSCRPPTPARLASSLADLIGYCVAQPAKIMSKI
jgi:hypothetical protein